MPKRPAVHNPAPRRSTPKFPESPRSFREGAWSRGIGREAIQFAKLCRP